MAAAFAPLRSAVAKPDVAASGIWPADALERVDCCPVCGSGESVPLYRDLEDTVCFCAPGRWTLWRCARCKGAYLNPRPTRETIGRAYSTYHTHAATNEPAAPGGALGRFRRVVRNGYLNARYHFDLQPASILGARALALLPSPRHDRAVRHLTLPRPGARLLDVGCGNGAFVRHAVTLGWDAEGLDPDPAAVAAGSGLGARLTTGSLPHTAYPDAAFAAVTLDHTIEHLHAPVAALRDVFRLLEPGGTVWIATPNLDSAGHQRFARHWRGLEPPRHLVLFTAQTLRTALAAAGYDRIRQHRGPFVSRWWFTASHRIAHGTDPLAEPGLALPLSVRLQARRADWRAYARPARGEEIIFTARRPP